MGQAMWYNTDRTNDLPGEFRQTEGTNMELTLVILLIAIFFIGQLRRERQKAARHARCVRLSAPAARAGKLLSLREGAAQHGWALYRGRRA